MVHLLTLFWYLNRDPLVRRIGFILTNISRNNDVNNSIVSMLTANACNPADINRVRASIAFHWQLLTPIVAPHSIFRGQSTACRVHSQHWTARYVTLAGTRVRVYWPVYVQISSLLRHSTLTRRSMCRIEVNASICWPMLRPFKTTDPSPHLIMTWYVLLSVKWLV